MRKRVAVTISIPVVALFVGLLVVLLVPPNIFILTEAFEKLHLLGSHLRPEGLVVSPDNLPFASGAPPLLIVNGTLWDAAGGARPNPGLAVTAGRFSATPAPGAFVIDATGLTILPGLIDMHIHSFGGTFEDEMLLANGVTSARDLGTQLAGILEHRSASERGERIGPRLFVTGPYLTAGAGTSDQEIVASTPSAARQIVERFADAGVDGIKVHSGIDEPTLAAVVQAAHARGLWVAVHPDRVGPAAAAALSADSIEHAWSLLADDPAVEDETIAALVAHHVALTPTLVVAEHAFTIPDIIRDGSPAFPLTPTLMRRYWISSQIDNADAAAMGPEEIARRRVRLEHAELLTGRFRQAGGKVLAGTDAPAYLVAPGFDIHRELELLVASGLSPEEALISATSAAAAALNRASEIGGLSPGMRADLLIVQGDPLKGTAGDPSWDSPTRRFRMVVKDGRVVVERGLKLTPTGAPQ